MDANKQIAALHKVRKAIVDAMWQATCPRTMLQLQRAYDVATARLGGLKVTA